MPPLLLVAIVVEDVGVERVFDLDAGHVLVTRQFLTTMRRDWPTYTPASAAPRTMQPSISTFSHDTG